MERYRGELERYRGELSDTESWAMLAHEGQFPRGLRGLRLLTHRWQLFQKEAKLNHSAQATLDTNMKPRTCVFRRYMPATSVVAVLMMGSFKRSQIPQIPQAVGLPREVCVYIGSIYHSLCRIMI